MMTSTAGRRRLRVAAMGAAVLLGGGRVAVAEPGDPKITTGGIHFGGTIAGPDVTPDSLAGRVVLLELWGIDCPPCAETMPALEQLHRTLGPQGLRVIGAHIRPGTQDEVRKAAAAFGVTFSIVGNTGVNGVSSIPQMPYTLLFDHTGKCVFRGSAREVRPVALAAVAAAPPLVLNGRPLTKLVMLYPLLKSEGSYGTALKKARGLTSARDADTADEARFVVDKLEAWGRDAVDKAAEARKADPAAAFDRLQRCATAFKGDPLAVEATKLTIEWKKDPAFRAELKSCEQLAMLEALRARVGGPSLTPDVIAAVPQDVKRQMKELADGVVKNAPGSKMAERAGDISLELSLEAAGRR